MTSRIRRPWPVVVFTGLAAWIVVVPLVGAFTLLFGADWSHGPSDYVVGGLLLALGIVLLRSVGRALFLEQLGVPLLLAGVFSLAHGLDRSLNDLQLEVVLLALTALLIGVLPLSWLRQLLGAAAAVLTLLILWHVWTHGDSVWFFWAQVHLAAAIGGLMLLLQHGVGGRTHRAHGGNGTEGAGAHHAGDADASGGFNAGNAATANEDTVLEPVLGGWWVVVLGALMLSAGPTFLLGGALGLPDWSGDGTAALPHQREGARAALWVLGAVSAALVGVGSWVMVRAWRPRQAWRLLPPVVVLALVATQLPELGACVAVLGLMLVTRRWRLALLAAIAVLWVVGSFYYRWQLPLQDKALVMAAAGLLLGAWAGWMALPEGSEVAAVDAGGDRRGSGQSGQSGESRESRESATPQADAGSTTLPGSTPPSPQASRASHHQVPPQHLARRPPSWTRPALGAFAVLVLLTVNVLIYQKETLIAQGRPIFVRLGPVDPMSLMQGHYMRLGYTLPGAGRWSSSTPLWGQRLRLAVTVDERGIVQSPRPLGLHEPVPAGMVPLELTQSRSGWTLVTDAWYFKEGEADRWARARYGEFRLMPDGRALLVNLVGEDLRPL